MHTLAGALLAATTVAPLHAAPAAAPPRQDVERRAEELLGRMTLAEKIAG